MPTYEYRCPEGHEFEHFYRKMSDAASELPCPECGKAAVRQLSGGAGLVFKGSGFYLTDYGKNAHRKGGGGSGTGTSGNSSGGEGGSKSESKSDAGGDAPKSESKAESKPAESKSGDAKSTKPASSSSSASSSKTDK